jgi:hypothetical protein
MHLVEILLPLTRRDGSPQPQERFGQVRAELVRRFGGVTAFTRAPAEGLWDDGGQVERDQIVTLEVMADSLDRGWWADYRALLEQAFEQDEVAIRATAIEQL